MLERVARFAPGAQLAWEAPMACGYGACYGCAVEIDAASCSSVSAWGPGPWSARRDPERLRLPRRAHRAGRRASLDAFVTKTVTPLPREGNEPVRIAETDLGMLNSIGLANPGSTRFLADDAPAPGRARGPDLGLGRRFSAEDYADLCAAPRRARRRGDRAERLVPERRLAGDEVAEIVAAARAGDHEAALREALAGGRRTSGPARRPRRAPARTGSRS